MALDARFALDDKMVKWVNILLLISQFKLQRINIIRLNSVKIDG